MRLAIRIDRRGFRRWHRDLATHLRKRLPASEIWLSFVEHSPMPTAAGPIAALLALERIVLRGSRETLCDPLDPAAEPLPPQDFAPEAVIDCTSGAPPSALQGQRVLRPLFDGLPGEEGLVAIVIARRMPHISIEDGSTDAILASGDPSAESADGLTGGIEAVVSRVMPLLEQGLTAPLPTVDRAAGVRPAPTSAARLAHFVLRNIALNAVRAIYHLCLFSPHWRIGWRFNDGPGVFERGDLGGPRWHVLRDPGTRFFADPFPIVWGGKRYVFFEDLDHRVGKGIISAIEFDADGPRGAPIRVLEEPWHLSYPFLIEHAGALWMVPESSVTKAVPIYRCIEFPHRWERAGTLLDGIEAGDCTILRHAGRFWMMSTTREGIGGYSDILRIHHAPDLLGPWEEHRRRPVLIDAASARPAGAIIERHGKLWRPIQDCSRGYGRAMSIARIDRLDADEFSQTIVARLTPGPAWPGPRLHTLNRVGNLECIDGSSYNPRFKALRGLAEARQAPADSLVEPPYGEGGTAIIG